MSYEAARRFLKDLESDQELQTKIVPAFDMERGAWKQDELTTLAAEIGYSFSMAELKSATEEVYGTNELTEEQLELISGGGCCCTCTLPCCCCCKIN